MPILTFLLLLCLSKIPQQQKDGNEKLRKNHHLSDTPLYPCTTLESTLYSAEPQPSFISPIFFCQHLSSFVSSHFQLREKMGHFSSPDFSFLQENGEDIQKSQIAFCVYFGHFQSRYHTANFSKLMSLTYRRLPI